MRVDVEKLKKKISDAQLSQEDVAKEIGVDYSTLFRKMKGGGVGFTIGQAHQIASLLALTPSEATSIFLAEDLQ